MILFLGAAASTVNSDLLHEDLLARKADLACALRDRTAFYYICGGYQLFGRYYKDQDQKEIQASLSFSHIDRGDRSRPSPTSAISRLVATIDRQTFNVHRF